VQKGQIISSGVTNVGGGTSAMIISDLSHIYVLASVDESDIGEVQIGQAAEITVDAYPRRQFEGRVDRIATTGINLQNVVTFEVRIEVIGENKHLLKPEMTAVVDIVVAEKEKALIVPTNSIVREARATLVDFVAAKGSKPERKPVELGITTPESTEILSGLKEGDTVVERRPEEESRWRNEGGGAGDDRRRQRMMMRTMGGGSSSGGRR
jgi:multidrug efflux pump subunit AcrA (membrane-fusion protein)